MLLAQWRWPILVGFAALVVLALALTPRLSFDSDPLDTQSPQPENMSGLQCQPAMLIESERAPTNMRLKAHIASRLNQLRDTNLRPR